MDVQPQLLSLTKLLNGRLFRKSLRRPAPAHRLVSNGLLGYWIIDVETPERAYAIAAEASAAPGVGGKPLNMGIEVRQVMSAPPKDFQ